MTTRTARIEAAISHVASMSLTADEADLACAVLRGATFGILRGQAPSLAMTGFIIESLGSCDDAWRGERAAVEVLEVLCGSDAAFERLSWARKSNVIRYALAVLGQWTDPSSGVGPQSVAIGRPTWTEVEAIYRATRKAA